MKEVIKKEVLVKEWLVHKRNQKSGLLLETSIARECWNIKSRRIYAMKMLSMFTALTPLNMYLVPSIFSMTVVATSGDAKISLSVRGYILRSMEHFKPINTETWVGESVQH